MFNPTEFLDLADFAHAPVFQGVEPVWEVLTKLEDYILETRGLAGRDVAEAALQPGSVLEGYPIIVGSGSIVEPGATIKGPALIGSNTIVRQGAYIRGPVLIGDNCLVGHASEVKGSIMLNGSKAPHFAYVGDSILGNRVNLGAGTKISNLRVLPGAVRVKQGDESWDTGLRKFGAVLGDDAETGCNAVLNPGTLIGPRSIVYPNCTVGGVIPPDTIVKDRRELELAERS